MIKIRTFNPRNAVVLVTFSIILASSITFGPWRYHVTKVSINVPEVPGFTVTNPESIETLTRADTSLTISARRVQGEEFKIEATLKSEIGSPPQNMNIDFYICGSEKIGTAKTDSDGVASLEYALPYFPRNGTYQIKAKFSGTTNYAQSSSEYVYIHITVTDYTPYIVGSGIIAVAIIGVVGYTFSRRRKSCLYLLRL